MSVNIRLLAFLKSKNIRISLTTTKIIDIKSSTVDGVETWQFTSEVSDYHADYKRASNAAPDPREIQMLAPSVPFNQKKYLDESNDDFQKEARLEIASRPVTRSTRSARSNRNIPLDCYLNDSDSVIVAKG